MINYKKLILLVLVCLYSQMDANWSEKIDFIRTIPSNIQLLGIACIIAKPIYKYFKDSDRKINQALQTLKQTEDRNCEISRLQKISNRIDDQTAVQRKKTRFLNVASLIVNQKTVETLEETKNKIVEIKQSLDGASSNLTLARTDFFGIKDNVNQVDNNLREIDQILSDKLSACVEPKQLFGLLSLSNKDKDSRIPYTPVIGKSVMREILYPKPLSIP